MHGIFAREFPNFGSKTQLFLSPNPLLHPQSPSNANAKLTRQRGIPSRIKETTFCKFQSNSKHMRIQISRTRAFCYGRSCEVKLISLFSTKAANSIPGSSAVEAPKVSPSSQETNHKDQDQMAIIQSELIPRTLSMKELIRAYLSLSKARLGSGVLLTAMVGFWMAPVPFHLSGFLLSSLGTSLAIASAGSFNQVMEIERDAKMSRTLHRILPTGIISTPHAIGFGFVTGAVGVGLLYYFVNPVSSLLAASNIILYACVYTPLKHQHPINTWVGAFVGAIPPMIGWAAATGGLEAGAWVLGLIIYVWQIPHFLSLAWNLRSDYTKAGYKMLSNVYPEKLPAATLRWSLYLLPMGALCSLTGITTWTFAFDSLLVDSFLIWRAAQFYKDNSNIKARKLFLGSLWFLPLFLLLMSFHRNDSLIDQITEEDSPEENDKIEHK